MLNVLSSQMNFTYTLYEVCDGAYGSEVIGRWTGVVGEVVYSHAHIGLANLGVNYARSSVVTFPRISTSYGGAGIVFHRLHKNCSSNLAVYFLPFSINVWACICVSVPVAALAIHLTTRPRSSLRVWLHRRQHRKRCHQQGVHLTQVFNTTAPSVLGQHPTPRPSIHSLQQNTLKAGRKDKTETSLKLDDRGRERKEEAVSFFNGVWFAATVLMQQGQEMVPETGAARVVFGTMWITAVVLYAAYTSNLVSFFTVTRLSLPFNNLEQLVRSDYRFGTRTGSVYIDNIKASESEVYREAWARLTSFGEEATVPTYEAALDRVRKESYAFIGDYVVLDYYQKKDCNLVLLKEQLFQSMSSIVLPHHSQLLPAINHYLAVMSETGVLDKLRERWWRAQSCPDEDTLTSYDSVDLWEVCSAMILMATGVAISLLVCFLEYAGPRFLTITSTNTASRNAYTNTHSNTNITSHSPSSLTTSKLYFR
ncbi:glutamate receptor ionotropic, delta-2-like isoform X2 [Cherax quadricarinatus]|uniref:glutamate receptor ionotropic, delta-2-like isoform X2 n=1 Tax=Cherax quadricarinatus TaxID=27406 RepID=UPI00387E2E38